MNGAFALSRASSRVGLTCRGVHFSGNLISGGHPSGGALAITGAVGSNPDPPITFIVEDSTFDNNTVLFLYSLRSLSYCLSFFHSPLSLLCTFITIHSIFPLIDSVMAIISKMLAVVLFPPFSSFVNLSLSKMLLFVITPFALITTLSGRYDYLFLPGCYFRSRDCYRQCSNH